MKEPSTTRTRYKNSPRVIAREFRASRRVNAASCFPFFFEAWLRFVALALVLALVLALAIAVAETECNLAEARDAPRN